MNGHKGPVLGSDHIRGAVTPSSPYNPNTNCCCCRQVSWSMYSHHILWGPCNPGLVIYVSSRITVNLSLGDTSKSPYMAGVPSSQVPQHKLTRYETILRKNPMIMFRFCFVCFIHIFFVHSQALIALVGLHISQIIYIYTNMHIIYQIHFTIIHVVHCWHICNKLIENTCIVLYWLFYHIYIHRY